VTGTHNVAGLKLLTASDLPFSLDF